MKKLKKLRDTPSHYLKWDLKMKLTTFLLLVSLFKIQASTYSQNTKISMHLENVTVEEVLNKIENSTEFNFLVDVQEIDVNRLVTVDADKKTIEFILNHIFANTNVTYELYKKQVILNIDKSKKLKVTTKERKEVIKQDEIEITGKVTDKDRLPLPGVNIVILGTTKGTETDFEGNYTINATAGDVLSFSYVGMETNNITVGVVNKINVILYEDASSTLDEVILVGYGSVKKGDLTGSVSSLSIKEFEQQPVTNASEFLKGRVAGVTVASPSGRPGGGQVIRIRGANSINANNDPLVVVDGLIGADFNALNPNNIQSMEILKDASATAIYGSRGANGVILITTKKGRAGKAQITFDYFTRISEVPKKIDILDGLGYSTSANNRRRYAKYSQSINDLTDYNYPTEEEMLTPDSNGNRSMTWLYYHPDVIEGLENGKYEIDWQDEIFRQGITNNFNLSVRGGTEDISYSVSGNYIKQEGIVINSDYEKFNLRASIDAQATNRLKIGTTVYLARDVYNPIAEGDGGVVEAALYALPVGLGIKYPENFDDPLFPFSESLVGRYFNHKGSYGGFGDSSPNGGGLRNPIAMALEPERENVSLKNTISTYLDYKIAEGLKLKITGGAMFSNNNNRSYYNELYNGSTNSDGIRSGSLGTSESVFYQNSNILTYNKDIDRHNFVVTGLFEQQYSSYSSSDISVEGFNNNNLGMYAIQAAENVTGKSSYKEERSILSFMGRLNYGFDDRYLFTASLRSDGSSVFGENNKWAMFPSGAFAWKVSNEEFLEKSKNIDNLKLRTSYGITGNQAIAPYQSLSQITTGGTGFNYPTNGSSLSIGSGFEKIANPDLRWEKTSQFDIGIDLSLFNHRLNVTADYYYKRTSDLLSSRSLAGQSGFTSVLQNVGDVENKGFEMLIDGTLIEQNDFSWTAGLNLTFNKNKVLNLSTPDEERIMLNDVMYLIKGQPLGAIYGYEYVGVWKDGEENEAFGYGQIAGTAKIVDQNNDGVYDEKDKVFLGSANPDISWGFNTTANYKGFSLNVQFQGVIGNEIYNAGARDRFDMEDVGATGYRGLERWHPINSPDGYYSRVDYSGTINQTDARINATNIFTRKDAWLSDIFVEDGSYIRLSNVTLAYDFDHSMVSKMGLEGFRLYLSGQNLNVWTDYTGFDPELSAAGGDALRGYERNGYPNARSYTLGVKIDF